MGKDSTNKIGRLRALKEVSNCRSLNPFDEFKELQEDSSSGLWQVWLFAVEGSLFAILQVLLYGRIAREDTKVSILLWIGSILATISVWFITKGHGGDCCSCVNLCLNFVGHNCRRRIKTLS